jgi:glycine dehydrogenase subunit 1
MPFIPHTPKEVEAMLETLELQNIQQLFDEIPPEIAEANFDALSAGMKELEISRLMRERMPAVNLGGCFIGAGAYEHHSPAIIGDLISRGEFYTAYTPYQAEASQGSLQSLYEYQTMMANLMGLDVSNASVYDGANALAEAALMAIRIQKHAAKTILIPTTVSPFYRQVLQTILSAQDIALIEIPYSKDTGTTDQAALKTLVATHKNAAALVIPQPNFFGILEAVDELTDFAHANAMLAIALVNPTATALLKEPGSWGEKGADIACGEGQSLGLSLSYGGPYFGFICCKKDLVRQLPGRIVGRTHDAEGREGYTLTLQTREQHIRRAKATSNICTNQGLFVTAATIYLTLMGANGLKSVAEVSHQNASQLLKFLTAIPGIELVFNSPFFHEFVIRLPKPIAPILSQLAQLGIQGGYSLKEHFPELGECLLVCATETKTQNDLRKYAETLTALCEKSTHLVF